MTSRTVAKFLGRAWVAIAIVASLFAGCNGKSANTSDSETHFLEKCTDTCSGGLTCLCGVCTKPCTASSSCGELSSSASCEDSCTGSSSKVCDVACSADADCSPLGADFGCSAGHCRQDSAQGADGGNGNAGGANGGGNDVGGGGAADVVAGSAGAATLGACRAAPDLTPSVPAPTALEPDLVARAAAVLGSCMPDDGVARHAAHLWLGHLRADGIATRFGAQLDCFANAACGCDAVEHCLSWVYRLIPADCTNGCEGEVVTGCGDGTVITADCSRVGLSCAPEGGCVTEALAACEFSEAPTCTAQGEVSFCGSGFRRETPCQSLGFNCVAGKCVGEGEACSATAPTLDDSVTPVGMGCSGGTLQACLGGTTTTVDCATQGPGFTCQSFDGSFFCGLAAECTPGNYAEAEAASCDGTVLTFCNAGRLEHIDCTSLGFTGCDIDEAIGHYGCTPILDVQ
jgi:hypothetical protein